MRKIFFAAIFFLSIENLSSQVYGGPEIFTTDFNNGIPAGWTILDVDGNTQIPFIANQGYTGAWQYFHHPGKNCVTVGTTGGFSDDYLISPAITLPAGQYLLTWRTCSSTEFNPQNYEMRISTTTPDAAGLNANPAVLTVTGETADWSEHQVNISSYAGQTVYIGLHSTGVGFALFADDIRISSPVAYDAAITSSDLPEVIQPGSYSFSGTIWNAGVFALTSYTLNWTINNGPVNALPSGAVNIAGGMKNPFSVSIPFNPSSNGTYLLKVWASALNSNNDSYNLNDTLTRNIFVNTFPKKLLVEEFTQAGCMPCAAVNPYFDSLLFPNLTAQKITAIKYHPSWPGFDQMYNDNPQLADDRVFYYNVPAVPEALVDGNFIPNYNASYVGDPAGLTQARIDSAQAYPAIFDIAVSNSTVASTNYVSVTVTAKTDIPMHEMHLYTVIIEDSVNFNGSNGEYVFYQVARQMLPADSGQILPPMNNNQSLTFNYSYPVTAVYDPSLLRTVAFVSDDATLKTYQSTVSAPYPNPNGVNEMAKDYSVAVYPNPASDNVLVSVNGIKENKISWSLENVMGEKIFSGENEVNENFKKQLDVSSLANGIYFFTLQDGEKMVVKKIVVGNR
jgi:hypothetical protein